MALASKQSSAGTAGDGRRPGYETVAAAIAAHISASGLRPGQRLPTERALGAQLGVSRTVVREAVKILSASGLVRARQGSGLYVAEGQQPFASAAIDLSMPVDPEHMSGLFEFRLTLETQTARLAAERVTPRELRGLEEILAANRLTAQSGQPDQGQDHDTAFHTGIAAATHNPFFTSSVATVHQLQGRAIRILIATVPGSLQVAAEEHAAIYEAIRAGRPDAAAAAMRTHIHTVMASYQQEVRRLLNTPTTGD